MAEVAQKMKRGFLRIAPIPAEDEADSIPLHEGKA
jgi:hypothetical protein